MAVENINPPCGVSEMENLLKTLECPFTWDMEKITKQSVSDVQHTSDNKEQELPSEDKTDYLNRLMKQIMNVYVDIKAKSDSKEILDKLKKCDNNIMGLKRYDHPEISVDVVCFILQSTQCFVFKELNLTKELEQTLSAIKYWKMNSKETSTLNACRSMCWSYIHCQHLPVFESEYFIRGAIKDNPNCGMWHYILGKNLRQTRRQSQFWSNPSEEEMNSFLIAYKMTNKHEYGVFVAHMYRELKEYKEAEKIYKMIYKQNPTNPTILLRLALGFTHLRSFTEAKACLDEVEAIQPHRSMFLHYRGIYHLNLDEYEEAEKFLKEASSSKNIAAEKQYLKCVVKIDKSFDIIQHLHSMLDKYKDFSKDQIQQLLLDLALTYWKRKDDIQNALIYFLKAVESNPKAKCINNYYICKFIWMTEKNIYRLLNREILPIVRKHKEKLEQSCIDRAEYLQKYCDQYFSKNDAKTLN